MEESAKLVQRVCELNYDSFPAELIDRVKYLFLDYLGVTLRGSAHPSSSAPQNLVRTLGADPAGTVVIGTQLKGLPPFAALANGIAAHATELDDVVNEASLHPGVCVMSTVLATNHLSDCPIATVFESIVAGYEVTVRLALALDPSAPYARGFHPTGTCGTMGSAMAAAKIMGLDRQKTAYALGIAGSQAAGSMEVLADGSYTKRFHAGWAAHSGIIAALLARDGFSGPGTILEGKYGFLHAYAGRCNPDRLLSDWATPYYVMKTSIKPHSCCRYKQGAIDCLLQISRDHQLNPADIEKITIGVLSAGFSLVAEPAALKQNPLSIVDAQFSMPFGAAMAILHGKAALDEYTSENIKNPEVKALMQKVSCVTDEKLDRKFPRKWPAWAAIVTKNGQELSAEIDFPKGDPENPLSWDELIDKFKGLAAPVLPGDRIDRIIDHVLALEKQNDLKSLAKLLTA
jgi:2-methylcitrate dehydratase PrpD